MENFCYWQENVPEINKQIYEIKQQKICLLRLNEYRLQKELNLTQQGERISIFCPYSEKNSLNCLDYSLIKDIK